MESSECNYIVEQSWSDDTILLKLDVRGVANIIFNREQRHNALNDKMIAGLNSALDYLENYISEKEHPIKVRVLLLSSNGKSFCAGADINSMQKMIHYDYQENYQDALNLARVLDRLYNFSCPTIARVQGSSFGGGVGFICCMDFAFGLESAEFCLSEVKLGIIPAVISPYIVSTMGLKQANRYVLSAHKFNAKQAVDLSILTACYKQKSSLDKAINSLIEQLLKNGPVAMSTAKKMLRRIESTPDYNKLPVETAEEIAKIRISPEAQEGLLAFIEKRKANWIK